MIPGYTFESNGADTHDYTSSMRRRGDTLGAVIDGRTHTDLPKSQSTTWCCMSRLHFALRGLIGGQAHSENTTQTREQLEPRLKNKPLYEEPGSIDKGVTHSSLCHARGRCIGDTCGRCEENSTTEPNTDHG